MKDIPETSTSEETREPQPTPPQDLESYLRDSLFGEDLRRYDEKLQTLTAELENTRGSLADVETRILKEIADAKTSYENHITNYIKQHVDSRMDELINRREDELEQLSTFINQFAEDCQAQIDKLAQQVKTFHNTNRLERQAFADALITLGKQLKEEL